MGSVPGIVSGSMIGACVSTGALRTTLGVIIVARARLLNFIARFQLSVRVTRYFREA
jgi:hypothetical protein